MKKKKYSDELKKRSYIEKYIPHVSIALQNLLDLPEAEKQEIEDNLKDVLERKRGAMKEIKQENVEYDKEFANIGKEEEQPEPEEENEWGDDSE